MSVVWPLTTKVIAARSIAEIRRRPFWSEIRFGGCCFDSTLAVLCQSPPPKIYGSFHICASSSWAPQIDSENKGEESLHTRPMTVNIEVLDEPRESLIFFPHCFVQSARLRLECYSREKEVEVSSIVFSDLILSPHSLITPSMTILPSTQTNFCAFFPVKWVSRVPLSAKVVSFVCGLVVFFMIRIFVSLLSLFLTCRLYIVVGFWETRI